MKTFWRNKLLCVLLIAALVAQCSAVAFAADPSPKIYYLVGGVPDENGVWTPEYWVDSDGNRLDETSYRVRAAAELPTSYDLRDYGLVTSVKHQAGSGSCWAFGTIASLESNYIRQGYGTLENTDFSEAHLVWFGQHQRTPDTTDPTYGDGAECATPFLHGSNWNRASATLMRGSGLQLEENARWITSYDAETLMQMAQPESERYVSYARMWSATNIRSNSADALKRKIMENGAASLAYYDNYTTDYTGYSSDKSSYYQTTHVNESNHIVAVIGWDDDYPSSNFDPSNQPDANGAWLVKGSWSSRWGDHGYYWISYEDPSLSDFVSYVAAPADVYDHIYQYDGATPNLAFSFSSNTGRIANVFTAERNELLTHVAFFSPNATPIQVTADVYVAPEGFQYSGAHPTNGMNKVSAATTTVSGVEYGYSTIELTSPTRLSEGQVFSVVLTMTKSGSAVEIPLEGRAVSNPGDCVLTYAGSTGTSFFGNATRWYDSNAYPSGSTYVDYNNVPLKAMTQDIATADPTLSLVTPPDKTVYSVGETLDTTGLSLLYTDEFGETQTVTEGFTCDPTTFSSVGTQTVTVTYDGLSVTFDVTVESNNARLTLESLPNKTTYLVGETLDTTGLTLLYTDEYGQSQTVTEGYTCDPTAFSSIGTQTVQVTYNGFSVTFNVTVEPHTPTLTLGSMPDKTTYFVGETLDTTGLSLIFTDELGVAHTVTEGYACDPATLPEIGYQTVSVDYNGLFVTFHVTVRPYTPTLTLQNAPDKMTYLAGETLDTTGLSLLYTDEYGDAVVVTEGFTCDPTTLSAAGTQTVTVLYNRLTVTFDVTVRQVGLFLVSDGAARAGETVDIAVRISDNPGIVSAWLEINYDPAVLTLEDVQNGEVFADSDLTPGHDLTAAPFRVLFLDALGENNVQNGDLVILTFRVRKDAPAGDSTVSVTYSEDSTFDAEMNDVPFRTQNGTFTVQRLSGDVNADGVIDLKDAVVLRRYLADWDVTINPDNAEVDGQAGLSLRDVATISRYLAGGYEVTLL